MGGTFSDIGSLKAAILADMQSAMSEVASQGLAKLQSDVGEFYSQGHPKVYQRTGQYRNSPRNDGVSVSGDSVKTTFRLETPNYYSDTGKSPETIMGWIEHGGPWIQGRTGRWSQFENVDIPPLVDGIFGAHFS